MIFRNWAYSVFNIHVILNVIIESIKGIIFKITLISKELDSISKYHRPDRVPQLTDHRARSVPRSWVRFFPWSEIQLARCGYRLRLTPQTSYLRCVCFYCSCGVISLCYTHECSVLWSEYEIRTGIKEQNIRAHNDISNCGNETLKPLLYRLNAFTSSAYDIWNVKFFP